MAEVQAMSHDDIYHGPVISKPYDRVGTKERCSADQVSPGETNS